VNDVPVGEHRESTLREPGRLDVEFLVVIDVLGELSKEFVDHDSVLVVGEAVVAGFI
jgi:hypothetical protein